MSLDLEEGVFKKLARITMPHPFEQMVRKKEKDSLWTNFGNQGSVLVEEAFLLYALVKLIKPNFVLDCGTYTGIAAMFMAEALRDNGFGTIVSIDHNKGNLDVGCYLLTHAQYLEIELVHGEAEEYEPPQPIGFLLLDTETADRVKQFNHFFPFLTDKSWVFFHDAGSCTGIEDIQYPFFHFATI